MVQQNGDDLLYRSRDYQLHIKVTPLLTRWILASVSRCNFYVRKLADATHFLPPQAQLFTQVGSYFVEHLDYLRRILSCMHFYGRCIRNTDCPAFIVTAVVMDTVMYTFLLELYRILSCVCLDHQYGSCIRHHNVCVIYSHELQWTQKKYPPASQPPAVSLRSTDFFIY